MRYVINPEAKVAPEDRAFVVGKTLRTGEKEFTAAFGSPTSLELDLLRIGAAIFASDRATARGENENLARHFAVSIPVVNIGQLGPIRTKMERVLHTLSNDWWAIDFVQMTGQLESFKASKPTPGQTLLFSGGLDSLAAAIQFGKQKAPLELVSHATRNRPTTKAQKDLVQLLKTNKFNVRHRSFLVSSLDASSTSFDHDIENSQRTRSFVFLILGALCARRSGHEELVFLAENGQMAIHLPLTPGRLGALSTHTAHPEVLSQMQALLRVALNYEIRIENPFVYKTKREVVSIVWKNLPQAIAVSTSCWKNARLAAPITHCGACIPCYVRRIAIEHHGTDATAYGADPWSTKLTSMAEDDDARRNLYDLAEFVQRFRTQTNAQILDEYPELQASDANANEVIQMYRRFSAEAAKVWSKYAGPKSLLA